MIISLKRGNVELGVLRENLHMGLRHTFRCYKRTPLQEFQAQRVLPQLRNTGNLLETLPRNAKLSCSSDSRNMIVLE